MEKNQFFDINKLPKEEGLLLFPISMSRIDNSQNPATCLKYVKLFTSKVSAPKIGLNFIYSDFLYLNSKNKASALKDKFMNAIVSHKNAMQKLILKNRQEFQIQHAFDYLTWNQLYLGTKEFPKLLAELKKIYYKDKKFQKYVKEDAKSFGKKVNENEINFFLEEHLMLYLGTKGKIKIQNDYIQGREKWILWCYPGRAPKALIYLYQLNPFRLKNPKNYYENVCQYNLGTGELYKIDNIDLESYSLN